LNKVGEFAVEAQLARTHEIHFNQLGKAVRVHHKVESLHVQNDFRGRPGLHVEGVEVASKLVSGVACELLAQVCVEEVGVAVQAAEQVRGEVQLAHELGEVTRLVPVHAQVHLSVLLILLLLGLVRDRQTKVVFNDILL